MPMILNRKDMNPFWTNRRDGRAVQVFGPKHITNTELNVRVMSVLLTPEYTKVHFRMVRKEGDLSLKEFSISPDIELVTPPDPSTFLGVKRFRLLNKEQSIVYPDKIYPEASRETVYFTLVFEPLPCYHWECDIIEEEGNYKKLNFEGLQLMKNSRAWNVPFSDN